MFFIGVSYKPYCVYSLLLSIPFDMAFRAEGTWYESLHWGPNVANFRFSVSDVRHGEWT